MAAALARLGLCSVKQVRVQFCSFKKNLESTKTFHQATGIVDYAQRAPHRPHRPGNAHGLRLPHPGQGHGRKQGQAKRQYQALTAQKKPTDFNLRLLWTLI
uniref:Uncharacterized protein n=1 Tax=Bos indicus x Bos taurus TaxID=30522 RepID=A0A4W2DPR5_BOBOX